MNTKTQMKTKKEDLLRRADRLFFTSDTHNCNCAINWIQGAIIGCLKYDAYEKVTHEDLVRMLEQADKYSLKS